MELHLTVEEFLELISPELKNKISEKLLEKILNDKINIIHHQHYSKIENSGTQVELSEDDMKFTVFDQLSWVSYYLYDFISCNYSSETKEYLILEEDVCKQKHTDLNVSMTVGGCTQIVNKFKMKPVLKIFKKGEKRIGANKYYLEVFRHHKQESLSEYLLELKTRGYELPQNRKEL